MFPASTGSRDNYSYWNQDITSAPLDPQSTAYIASIGAATNLHADFGTTFGIPFVTVSGDQPKVAVTFDSDESDPGPYPIPPNAPIEDGGDGHVLVVDRDACVLYETFASVYHANTNSWSASSGAVFDLKSGALRTEGFTSADASGGPIFVGLARFEEVAAGAIHHALRFTASRSQRAYAHPATHFASGNTSTDVPPMGLRVRMQSSACTNHLTRAGATHPQAKVIIEALCMYGLILTDNGSNWFISGAPDPRWDNEDLDFLKTIPGGDFEAIETGPLVTN